MNAQLPDQHGRTKRKLRISLTDRCNFRCTYCMPEHPTWLPRAQLLSGPELLRLAGLFIDQGITQIRLTGGEPLLRPDLLPLVDELQGLRSRGLERISMTTNASRMAPVASRLVQAGIDDFNVSLDAIDADTFKNMTGRGIAPVLEGIQALQDAGASVKLNAVVVRGQNEHQVLPLLEWSMQQGLPLRYIEYMPLDAPGHWQRESVVGEDDILAAIGVAHDVEKLPRGADPASPYQIDGHFPLGIISTVTHPFCASCDRLRITATGELYTCLFSRLGTPLGVRMRAGDDDQAIVHLLRRAVWNKEPGYASTPGPVDRPVLMHAMGG
ncbi:GTP 3',8-cyclase MoaA [Pinirhizobacter sp.]|uniref:GTP 3',8-cyclase MoaA n=1 Tax=Pinirhizobacter sp. TaxID=2950432 RepID=UPI002F3F325B